ncbi:hypothetical protein CHELA40_11802 [Chelatococcus asaccharovorans]|nr:hypothetical protein CHELA40_11802 [Chelatococcus asaccharovorans]CAH1684035.1 hypothetical protein CHELA17_63798 [Chelatococcus asaccharovorans]
MTPSPDLHWDGMSPAGALHCWRSAVSGPFTAPVDIINLAAIITIRSLLKADFSSVDEDQSYSPFLLQLYRNARNPRRTSRGGGRHHE